MSKRGNELIEIVRNVATQAGAMVEEGARGNGVPSRLRAPS
jgi:hypothetical protein